MSSKMVIRSSWDIVGMVIGATLWVTERAGRYVGLGERSLELAIDIATLVSIVIAIIVGIQKIMKNRRDRRNELERRAAKRERTQDQH